MVNILLFFKFSKLYAMRLFYEKNHSLFHYEKLLMKSLFVFTFTETTSSLTGVFAGSVVGALVLVTVILILVFFVHRRYTCIFTFKIGNVYFFLPQSIGHFYWMNCHCLCFHIHICFLHNSLTTHI